MHFIENLSIRKKLILMLVFPLIGLTIFTIFTLNELYQVYVESSYITTEAKELDKTAAIIHELQKERGLSVGFSNKKDHTQEEVNKLKNQRELSDKTIEELKKDGVKLDALEKLGSYRSSIDSISSTEIAQNYTNLIANIMSQTDTVIQKISGDFIHLANTYKTISHMKEIRGQTRAMVNGILTKDIATREELYKTAGQNAHFLALEKVLDASFPNEIKNVYENSVRNAPERQLVMQMLSRILEKAEAGKFGIEPKNWFDSITILIDA